MNKKKIEKIARMVIPTILFILVLLVVLSFNKDSENIIIDNNPPTEKNEEIKFNNLSDMEESEIRELVERKKLELQNFFKELKYYIISEVAEGYTKEDDENYIVIGESSLETLRSLLTIDAYGTYWDQLTEVTPKYTIQIRERVYMGEKNLFTNLFTHSAIATHGVNVESLILKSATNEKIEAIENIKYCEENTYNICQRDESYSLTLEMEENTWKINEFTNLLK